MRKDLTTTENTEVALSRTKSFMGAIGNIFNNKIKVEDDSWMQRLWDWADENDISDMEWFETDKHTDGGYFFGIPRNKDDLATLLEIDIALHNLQSLPVELGHLINLNGFLSQRNIISSFPKELCKLVNLNELQLQYNNLSTLPIEIGNLTNLVYLDLEKNIIVYLPRSITNLKKLKFLVLSDNKLEKLPSEIGKLSNLIKLNLRKNRLVNLSNEIGKLNNLIMLDLSDNIIKILPDEICSLVNLRVLYLSSNPLTFTEKQRIWINGLIEDGCEVYFDDDVWERSSSSQAISNSENTQEVPQSYTLHNQNQEKFNELVKKIYGRDFDLGICFEHNISFESFEGNKLTWKSDADGNDRNMLKKYWDVIYMFVQDLFGIDTEVVNIEDDGWIQRLWDWADENDIPDLSWEESGSGGYWYGLPRNRTKLYNMKELNISWCKLKKLPKEIGNLKLLTNLILSGNLIKNLPKEIGNLRNIISLALGSNEFTVLPKEICKLTRLTEFQIDYNMNLVLMQEQKNWINNLQASGCDVEMDDDLLARTNSMTHMNIKKEETDYQNMYDDVEFDEGQMAIALGRSMEENSIWIYMHTNLIGALEWMENDGWDKQDTGIYIYPLQTDEGQYKKIEVGYDGIYPVLRASLVNDYNQN